MDELSRVLTGLRINRPSITIEQLLSANDPSACFEAHIPDDSGKDFWIFSIEIDGTACLLDGDAMVIRASKSILILVPDHIETTAQEGLRDTIAAARRFDVNTGLQAEVEMRPAQ